jgi:hypothetical protein
MKQHRHLSLRKPQATSLSRGTSFNKHNVAVFFSKLTEVMNRYHFTLNEIYNLDRVVTPTSMFQNEFWHVKE